MKLRISENSLFVFISPVESSTIRAVRGARRETPGFRCFQRVRPLLPLADGGSETLAAPLLSEAPSDF